MHAFIVTSRFGDAHCRVFSQVSGLSPRRKVSCAGYDCRAPGRFFPEWSRPPVGADFRTWTADDQEFASSIANIVSLMVESHERKAAEEKLKRSNQELSKANDELMVLRNQLEQENTYLRNELDLVFNFEEMIYGSALFSNVLTEVEKVATTNATVLLLGESGTGKELLARQLLP